jgi:hypothetical protein
VNERRRTTRTYRGLTPEHIEWVLGARAVARERRAPRPRRHDRLTRYGETSDEDQRRDSLDPRKRGPRRSTSSSRSCADRNAGLFGRLGRRTRCSIASGRDADRHPATRRFASSARGRSAVRSRRARGTPDGLRVEASDQLSLLAGGRAS